MKKGKFAILSVVTTVIVLAVAVVSVYFFGEDKPDAPVEATQQESITVNQETQAPTQPDIIDQMLDEMTIEQKVAQMIMCSCHEGINIEAASSYGVGGLCLYGYSFENKSADEVIEMIKSYQALSSTPLLVSTDEEGGTVVRVSSNPQLRATPFLSPSGLKEQGGLEAVFSDTVEKSQLLLSLGVNVNLAPVCDVPLDETNYIYDRCYSLNAEETAQYAQVVTIAMKENNMGSCLKHFPGYGGSVDTHQSMSYDNRDLSAFENGDFLPFEAGIDAGADCVLVSHNIVSCMDSEMPASLSKPVHDILRTKLGFDGVVMTDDLVMEGIAQFTDGSNAAVMAVKAGNDMIICEDFSTAVSAIVLAVENGEIEEAQIDESVTRILNWKKNLGLFN